MSLTSIVNPETPPPRPSHVLATYRWPLVIVVLGLLALFAVLAFLWVAKRAYEDTLTRGGRAGEFAAQKAEDVAEKFMRGSVVGIEIEGLRKLRGGAIVIAAPKQKRSVMDVRAGKERVELHGALLLLPPSSSV